MSKHYHFIALSLACAALLQGCSNGDDPQGQSQSSIEPYQGVNLSAVSAKVASTCNDFSWRVLQSEVAATGAGKTLTVSPLSLCVDLGMLANGASGVTRQEILSTMGFESGQINQANDYFNTILAAMPSLDRSVKLGLANSFWHKPYMNIEQSFSESMSAIYRADFRAIDVDFVNEANSWCSDATNGLIPQVINPEKDYAQVLFSALNAVYFKGQWADGYKFEKANNVDRAFNNADGSHPTVTFMSSDNELCYCQNDRFELCSIPFGNGGFSLFLILPRQEVSVESAVASVVDEGWNNLVARSREYKALVHLALPKFKIAGNTELLPTLSAMGMTTIGNPDAADFSAMTSGSMFIGLLDQYISFEINEDGVEAAAVSDAEGWCTSSEAASREVTMCFDRPFIFAVADSSTKAIMFAGVMANM